MMIGVGLDRHEAAADLVFALGAGLERLEVVSYAVIDTLVVARLEVNITRFHKRTPITTVQTGVVSPEHAAGKIFSVSRGYADQELLVESLCGSPEEATVQARQVAVEREGCLITICDRLDFSIVNFPAIDPSVAPAILVSQPALAADVLARFAAQFDQERIEIAVVAVAPVKLPVEALQPFGLVQRLAIDSVTEIDAAAGQLTVFDEHLQALNKRGSGIRVPAEQARAGHRGERRRYQQLGIPAQTGPVRGFGPGEIEHEFTVRVRFQPGRGTSAGFGIRQRRRSPAGLTADATGLFECCKKAMIGKRVVSAIQRIPGSRIDSADQCRIGLRADRGIVRHPVPPCSRSRLT